MPPLPRADHDELLRRYPPPVKPDQSAEPPARADGRVGQPKRRAKREKAPRPSRDGGRKARAAATLIGLSATVGALVALGTAMMIYLIVLAIQQALS